MSTASNISYLEYGSSFAAKPFLKGWNRVRLTATINSGDASCTITNVPNYVGSGKSDVIVAQQQTGGTAKLIQINSGETRGPVGTIVIGTANGSTVANDTNFMLQVVNL